MGYLTLESIEDYKNQLKFIIDTAEYYIDPTPNHPKGCARQAWINQAQYWLQETDNLIVGIEYKFDKQTSIMLFIKIFISDYYKLLKKLGINVR